jgi:hypothetical protein
MARRCLLRRWTLAISLVSAFGSVVRSDPPKPSARDLLDEVRADAPPPRSAAKSDGSRFTTSAARYADAKFTFAPPTKAKWVGRMIPAWLHFSSPDAEKQTLGAVPEVGLPIVRTTAQLAAASNRLVEKHGKGSDAFVDALAADFPDLRGLPFLKGAACATDATHASQLTFSGQCLRCLLDSSPQQIQKRNRFGGKDYSSLAEAIVSQSFDFSERNDQRAPRSHAALPAMMQILAVETPDLRVAFVSQLQSRPIDAATITAFARFAIFDPDATVRSAAVDALRRQPFATYGPRLINGLRHPWPAAAEHAAEALVGADAQEALPDLVRLLDEADPTDPFERQESDKKIFAVREVVKINHHRNCMLCHAPAVVRRDDRRVQEFHAKVPDPSEPLPRRSEQYNPTRGPIVRVDETYLRQDFSMMQAVEERGAWPKMQRFDYLVRTRPATAEEVQASQHSRQWSDEVLSPHRRAVLYALSRLTCTYVGPNASDWRPEIARWIASKKERGS